jgi:uncharacterized protein (DUF1330 family)
MSSVVPKPEALSALAQSSDEGPVVMLNLLKFKKGSGEADYMQYGEPALKMVEALGGRVLFVGRVEQAVVGDSTWDAVALVEYPSRKAFLKMISDPEYLKLHAHRERGLERTELIALKAGPLR